MRILILVFAIFLSLYSFSQKGKIVGKVRDQSGELLFGATVMGVVDKSIGTTTDDQGNYMLETPVGKFIFICRYTGMLTDTLEVFVIENQVVSRDITLSLFAKEIEMVEIKVGKYDTPYEDQTVSMEIIRPQLIENKNTRSIETALNQTPGLNILDGEPQIRGGSGFTFGVGSKVAVIVDDMPMLSGDAGRPEWGFIPVENIAQIEVIKGASSVLSGSSALSGAIHIRTAYPTSTPLTKVNVYSGGYSSPSIDGAKWWTDFPLISGANFLHSRQKNNWDLVFGGNLNYDHGYIGAPKPGQYVIDTISNFTDQQMASQRARLNFNIRHRSKKYKGLNYGVNGNFMLAKTNMAFAWLDDTTGLYRAYPGAVFLQDQLIFNADPYINYYNPTGGKHSLRTRLLYSDNIMTANQSNQATVLYGDYQFQRKYKQLGELDFIGGLTSMNTASFANLYVGSGSPYNNLLNVSAYTQMEKKFQQTINFSVGGRLEYYNLNDSITALKPVFRTGTSIKIYQETFLRMSYGQGYRFPTITERFIKTGVGSFGVFPNPTLQPETSWNAEVGIKQGLKFKNILGYIDIAGFWQEYQNTIEYMFGIWDLSNPKSFAGFKFLNTGRSRVVGIDISFSGQAKLSKNTVLNFITGYNYIVPKTLNPDLVYATDDFGIQYSYNSTSLDSSSGILKYRFLHNVKGDFELVIKKKIAVGMSVKYFSKMVNMDGVIKDFEELTTTLGADFQTIRYMDYYAAHRFGNWIYDARISYNFSDKHKLALIGTNVLNRSYSLRPLKIESPRTIMIQYTLKF